MSARVCVCPRPGSLHGAWEEEQDAEVPEGRYARNKTMAARDRGLHFSTVNSCGNLAAHSERGSVDEWLKSEHSLIKKRITFLERENSVLAKENTDRDGEDPGTPGQDRASAIGGWGLEGQVPAGDEDPGRRVEGSP